MTTVTVIFRGEHVDLTEQDVKKLLIERALDVARNPRVRSNLSEVLRSLQAITNEVYRGRQELLKNWGYIPVPFPEAWKVQENLVAIFSEYCLQQYSLVGWEDGWEDTIVPQINAL